MKRIGFFREYFKMPEDPSIFDFYSEDIDNRDHNIIEYLEQGLLFLFSRTGGSCVITGKRIKTEHYYTDGVWIWTVEYIHHVRENHIPIGRDFLKDVKSRNYNLDFEGLTEDEVRENAVKFMMQFYRKRTG